jgi:autotransporter translocation and assembly factor TamB
LVIRDDGTLDINNDMDHIPLANISPLLGDIPLTGILTGSAHMEGPWQQLNGYMHLRVDDLTAYDFHLEHAEFSAQAENGLLQITGSLLNQTITTQVQLRLDPKLHHTAQFELANVQVPHLWRGFPREFRLALTGTLQTQGNLSEPKTLTAKAMFSGFELGWREVVLNPKEPVHLTFRQRTLNVEHFVLDAPMIHVALSGKAPLDGALQLHLDASGDLQGLGHVRAFYSAMHGPFAVNLMLKGHMDDPQLEGTASLQNASIFSQTLGEEIRNLEVQVGFFEHTMQLNRGKAKIGDGDIAFSGFINYPKEYSINASLQKVPARPFHYLNFVTTGELNLSGPLDRLTLAGKLNIESLRYTKNIDFEDLIPNRDAPPLQVPDLGESPILLNIHLIAPKNILLVNNILDAELQFDLNVTGTTARTGLIGTVTPIRAKARYRDNIFTVDNALIDFIDEYRVIAQFDLIARTKACGMNIGINISGNSNQYTVLPTAQDEHGLVDAPDILSCLQFGFRLQHFEGPNAAGVTDTLPGNFDAIWTVSGLDEKVKQLLPIKVDEFRLTSAWSSLSKRTTPTLVVGKTMGKDLNLRYSASLDEYYGQSVSLDYNLSQRTILQGGWASDTWIQMGNLGVDIRLHWELR